MSFILGYVAMGVGGYLIDRKVKKDKEKNREAQQLKTEELEGDVTDADRKLANLENSRQGILNQAGAIREMKSQVFNPYANLAVANKAADLKIEQTDEALANTLESINRSGTGTGAATALARMAAQSKAQVGATLETQEIQNQKLRLQGEAQVITQKQQIEQAALGAEAQAWGRGEVRDVAMLDRLAGLQENAQARALAYEQQIIDQKMQKADLWVQAGAATAQVASTVVGALN